jgi:hypothetical protein
MVERPTVSIIGLTPLERHITLEWRENVYLHALEVERTLDGGPVGTTDGLLCLTAWSEKLLLPLMMFVVERIRYPGDLDALHVRCKAHRLKHEDREAAELAKTSDLSEIEARGLIEQDFPYQVGLCTAGPVPFSIQDAYMESGNWSLGLKVIAPHLLEGS